MAETVPARPNLNIAPIYGSIHSTGGGGSYPERLIDGAIHSHPGSSWYWWTGYLGSWVIIDLSKSFLLDGFKAWGGAVPTELVTSVSFYQIWLSDDPDPEGFELVKDMALIPRPINWDTCTSDTVVITPRTARYVMFKVTSGHTVLVRSGPVIDLDGHRLTEKIIPEFITATDFEIYGVDADTGEELGETATTFIFSAAEVYHVQGQADISSTARVVSSPVAKESFPFTSDVTFITGNNISSNTWVIDIGGQIGSNANILAPATADIASNMYVYRGEVLKPLGGSATAEMSTFMVGRAVNHADWVLELETSGSRDLLVYNTTDISTPDEVSGSTSDEVIGSTSDEVIGSTSDEVIVDDMITGSPMDMSTTTPPLGYQNYDWKYDWVVRTYNDAQYKFEIRTGDKLSELNTAVFNRIQQGQIISRGQIPKYHQWRCHVWASGSGDFELHQFTIKGYVDYPANPLYRALQNQPFTTVSSIKKNVQRLYEPLDPKLWGDTYIPGDCNADGIVDVHDLVYLSAYISSEGSAPNPIQAGDVNYDATINEEDFTYLTQYLHNNGPPPIWDIT